MAEVTVPCLHCDSKMKLKSSDMKKGKQLKRMYFQCNNVICSWSAVYGLSPIHTLSESGIPKNNVNIPKK